MRFLASHAQRRVLFFEQRRRGSPAYNIPRLFDLSGDLCLEALEQAFADVVERHACLRLRFELVDGDHWAVIEPSTPAAVNRLSEISSDEEADRELLRLAREPFDTARGPLFRIAVATLRPGRHRVLLVLHHTCADDIAVKVIVRDWVAAYECRLRSKAPDEPGVSIAYSDCVAWEREFLDSAVGTAGIAAFADDIRDVAPSALVGESNGDGGDGRISVAIGDALVREVEGVARDLGCTPFMFFGAILAVLLQRYTNESDVLFGIAIGNRYAPGAGEVVGDFVNTAPFRLTVEGGAFSGLLKRSRKQVFRCLQHGAAPIDLAVRAAGRSGESASIGIVLLENLEPPPFAPVGLRCVTSVPWTGAAKVALQVSLERAGAGRVLNVEFSGEHFSHAAAERFALQFLTLLEEVSVNPERDIALLSVHTAQDLDRLRQVSHGQAVDLTFNPVHELILAQCRARSDDVAVLADGDGARSSQTYGELEQWSRRVASRVLQNTVAGQPVAVFSHRSCALSAGLLGVLRSGRVYFALDPDYPDDRLALMLAEAEPGLVLAGRDLTERACLAGLRVACLEDISSDNAPIGAVDVDVDPSSPAYLLYTSGSTGRPKGVVNAHLGLANRLNWMQRAFPIDESDVVLHKTPISFDVSVWELIWPLMRGAKLLIAKPQGHRDPNYLRTLIDRERVTIAHFVPSMLRLFLNEIEASACASIRRLVCSGEALSNDLVDKWLTYCGGEIHNLYGPTEAAIDVTSWRGSRSDRGAYAPIGRPIQNTSILILDAKQRPAPLGAVGEIYIGGQNLALGYWRRPELTAAAFVDLPLGDGDASIRLYKTGDRGRWREDGAIEFLGRSDGQVKLNGVRIELSEIEALLLEDPSVQDAAVVLQNDDSGEGFLVAFVVAKEMDANWAKRLSKKLPATMTPKVFQRVDALPQTQSGKLNRAALPRIDRATLQSAKGHTPPRDARERAIVEVWEEVLRRERVGIDDDFFVIGGDSLRSLRVVARLRAAGLDISVADMLAAPTIRALAPRIAEVTPAASSSSAPATRFPAPRLVQALWLNSQTSPAYRAYLTSYHVRARYDEAAMRRVAQRAVDRHPMLRASVSSKTEAGRPIIQVHSGVSAELDVFEMREMTDAKQREALSVWYAAESARPWRWDVKLSCRFTVHRRSDDEFQFSILEPWLDGWSVKTLTEEILRDYNDELLDNPRTSVSAPTLSYAEFVLAEDAALDCAEHRAFWLNQIQGFEPALVSRTAPTSTVRVPVSLGLPATTVRDVAIANRLPLKHLLMAIHMAVMGAITGRSRASTGVMFNGRAETIGADRVLGLYLNALPMSVPLQGKTWIGVARDCLAKEAEITPWRRFPGDELRRMIGEPVFDTLFNFTDFTEIQNHDLEEVEVLERIGFDQTYMALCAQFGTDLAGRSVTLDLEVDDLLFDRLDAGRLASLYSSAFETACSTPDALVEAWDPARGDRELLTVCGNGEVVASDRRSLIEIFNERCETCADKDCIIDNEKVVSFREFKRDVEAIAGALYDIGVRQGDRVGICLPRSYNAITAILGIVRVGAAFVPLPLDAAERRSFMIGDAAISRVISANGTVDRLTDAQVFDIDDLRGQATLAPEVEADLSAPLHVLYTSGSTGLPKGVETSAAVVLNRLRWMWTLAPFTEGEVMAHKTALGFVDSVWELFGGLLAGIPTFIVSEEEGRTALTLSQAIERGRCTRLTLVPSVADAMLHDVARFSHTLRSLRVLIVSGEPLREQTAARLLGALPQTRLLNLYGSTETGGDATFHDVLKSEEANLIGRPIAGSRVAVIDEIGRQCPVGVPGEIVVAGACLATRYIGWASTDAYESKRWRTLDDRPSWATGDIGYWRRDGALAIVGRRDRQLKVRGMRIEPGEIESALLKVAGVRKALAAVGPAGELVAFVEAEGLSAEQLRAALLGALPAAMTPSKFVIVERFAQTLTGKVDVSALLELAEATRVGVQDDELQTDMEVLVAEVMRQVFPGKAIARSSNFFDLGGHSLLAGSIVARLRQRLKRDVPMRVVFDHAVLSDLAHALSREHGSEAR